MEIIFGTVLLVFAYILSATPAIAILFVVWKLTKRIKQNNKILLRSVFISLAFAPAVYGHAGILPAIYVLMFPEAEFKLAAFISLLVIFVISFAVMYFRGVKNPEYHAKT